MTEEDHPKLVIEKVFNRNGYAFISSGAATSTQPPGVASRSQHRWRILPILFCRPYVSSKTAQPTAAPDASVTSRPPHQRDGLRPLRQELFDAGDGAAPVQCFGGCSNVVTLYPRPSRSSRTPADRPTGSATGLLKNTTSGPDPHVWTTPSPPSDPSPIRRVSQSDRLATGRLVRKRNPLRDRPSWLAITATGSASGIRTPAIGWARLFAARSANPL